MMIHLTPIESPLQKEESKVLIIGDLLIDRTWKVKAKKLSPEAPVPVVQKIANQPIETPGGAGITACYFKKNFKDVPLLFYTVTSKVVAKKIVELGIEIDYQEINNKDVIVKERYIDVHSKYHLLRVDNDDIAEKTSLSIATLTTVINENNIGCVILMDYKKGIFDNEVFVIDLIEFLKQKEIPIYVDTRAEDLSRFAGSNIIKLNEYEYEMARIRFGVSTPQILANTLNVDNIIITRGENGASLYSRGEYNINRIPVYNKTSSAPDVTGCGDAFDATFCYYYYVEKKCASTALSNAVNKATEYAYQPIEERLCLP